MFFMCIVGIYKHKLSSIESFGSKLYFSFHGRNNLLEY